MRILADATAVGDGGGGICTFLLGLLSGWSAAGFEDDWRVVGMRDLPDAVDALVPPPGLVLRGGNPWAGQRILTQQVRLPVMAHAGRVVRVRPFRSGSRSIGHSHAFGVSGSSGISPSAWAPDVVLATTPVIPVVPAGVPVVAMVHDLRYLSFPNEFSPLTRWYRMVAYRYGIRHAHGLLTNSEFTRDEVNHVGGHRGSPVVIYLGADHVDRWPAVTPAQGHGITFGHWSNKQPDVAVQAWALLRGRREAFGAKLHVVGVPSLDWSSLAQLSRELGIADLVEIHPFLQDADYRSLFASASVVLLPSTTEGFGLPVAEAQRLGIPVVTCGVGGVREVGGDAALYSDDGSPSSYAALCARALFDLPCRAEMIRRGRDYSSRFTWRSTAERTRAELQRCVGCQPDVRS